MEDRVTFTSGSADRIAKVVRIVEAGTRDCSSSPPAPRLDRKNQAIRFCSWTASWTYAETSTIRFEPAGVVTATANNVILSVAPGDGWVAKKGSAGWCLIGFDMTKQYNYSSTTIQLFGHDESAFATWYSIATCSTATAAP